MSSKSRGQQIVRKFAIRHDVQLLDRPSRRGLRLHGFDLIGDPHLKCASPQRPTV